MLVQIRGRWWQLYSRVRFRELERKNLDGIQQLGKFRKEWDDGNRKGGSGSEGGELWVWVSH